ncbi:MAG: glycosyltransferase family 2 protein [Gammaproteobacteria bacterium]|nr:glycosyltransferase family 2 protein [Gammaproteobacteria bacterium]
MSISLVTFAPSKEVLRDTLESVALSLRRALASGEIGKARVMLVDNGPDDGASACVAGLASALRRRGIETEVVSGHGNVGYGRGNNLAMERCAGDFHLVLNPDVVVEERALATGVAYLAAHPDVVLIAPAVIGQESDARHLCKRHPTVIDLLLRGFAPNFVKRLFQRRLDHYELADVRDGSVAVDVPIVSGSFMLCRGEALRAVGGFDPAFFMYFEDFDLSLRLGWRGRVELLPAMRIRHAGGGAARKGRRHIIWFGRSAVRFFSKHGWRWW